MKKIFSLLVLFIGLVTLVACTDKVDDSIFESAFSKIEIGYQDGDNKDNVTKDITLPLEVDVEGITISWVSSDTTVVSANGKVIRPVDEDKEVILTLTISYEELKKDKEYKVIVKKQESTPIEEVDLDEVIENNKIVFQTGDNKDSVTKNITLPKNVTNTDVSITWTSNNQEVISNEGVVTQPTENDVIVKLTVKVTYNNEIKELEYSLTVKKIDNKPTLTIGDIVAKIEVPEEITENINLPIELDGASISWSSDDSVVLSASGLVNRQSEDVVVNLTAIVSYNGEERTLYFEVLVLANEVEYVSVVVKINDEEISKTTVESGSTFNDPSGYLDVPEGKRISHFIIEGTEKRFNFENDVVTTDLVLVAVLVDEFGTYTYDFGTKSKSGYIDQEFEFLDQEGIKQKFKTISGQLDKVDGKHASVDGVGIILDASRGTKKEASFEFIFNENIKSIMFSFVEWSENEFSKNEIVEVQVFENDKWISIYVIKELTIDGIIELNDIESKHVRIYAKNNSSARSRIIIDNLTVTTGEELSTDTEAPKITVSQEVVTYFVGNTIPNLNDYVTVTDNQSRNPIITFSEEVDYTKVGEYTLTITAKDRAGNTSTAEIKVVVRDTRIVLNEIQGNSNVITINYNEVPYIGGVALTDIDFSVANAKLDFLNKIIEGSLFTTETTDETMITIEVTEKSTTVTIGENTFKKDAFNISDNDKNGVVRISIDVNNALVTKDNLEMIYDIKFVIKYSILFENGAVKKDSNILATIQTIEQAELDEQNDPVYDDAKPIIIETKVEFTSEEIILTVSATDQYLKNLVIKGFVGISDLVLYANTDNVYGNEANQKIFTDNKIEVIYEDGLWIISFKGASYGKVIDNKGFELALSANDYAENTSESVIENLELVKINYVTNSSEELNSQVIVKGTEIELPIISKESSELQGWYENSEFTGEVHVGTITINTDLTLYAKWIDADNSITITYLVDGATYEEIKSTKDQKINAPANTPKKDGYTFAGWYKEDVLFDFENETVDIDLTLIAKWNKWNQAEITNLSVVNEKLELGFKLEKDLNLDVTENNLLVSYFVKVNGEWMPIINTTNNEELVKNKDWAGFLYNQGVAFVKGNPTAEDYNADNSNYLTTGLVFVTQIRNGKSSDGTDMSYHELNFGNSYEFKVVVTVVTEEGTTKTEQVYDYKPEHTVDFVLDVEEVPAITAIGGQITVLPLPVKEGFKFVGWFYDKELTQQVEDEFITNKNVTLYGSWKEVSLEPIIFTISGSKQYGSDIDNDSNINKHLTGLVEGVDVIYIKNNASPNSIFNNSAKEIRLYKGSGNGGEIKITANGLIKTLRIITSKNAGYSINGGEKITDLDKTIQMLEDSNSVSIKNISGDQVRIKSIEVTYIPQ